MDDPNVPLDPQRQALSVVDALVARDGPLTAAQCLRLSEHAPLVPGRMRRIARRLSDQGDSAAVEGLLLLPRAVPGVVEGLYRALAAGTSRRRLDGTFARRAACVEFRRSRARAFPQLLARAHALLPDGFESLDVGGKLSYRVQLAEGRGTLAGRAAAVAGELQWLYGRLSRHAGTRLWINGWLLASEPKGASVGSHLLQAFLSWASQQVHTRPHGERP